MNRNKEFISNTIILFIGKFATQFMSLLLLPLYTHFLIAYDFGWVDLLQTYITLFIPVLTLRLDSAIFRFLVDKRCDENYVKKIISNVLLILSILLIVVLLITGIIFSFIKIKYIAQVIINLLILMISNVLLQLLRGLGKGKEYSIASIITGFVTLISNIICIITLKMDASSILISSSIANIICIIFIICNVNLFKYLNFNLIDFREIKSILKYSTPMIINALSWWIVNVSDRTIISIFLGTALNGVYTISCKFSNIINNVFSIFNMSWQESASLHIEDEDKDEFFTDIINKQLFFFSSISILIVVFLPFFYDLLIGQEYLSSYNYIPILLYANIWNILTTLIGGIYIAKKRTKEVANTTLISAIINIIINVVLIKYIGLYAACISTLLAYMIMCIYRYRDSKKYIDFKLNVKGVLIFSLVFMISSILYFYNNLILNIINVFLVLIYVLYLNKEIIITIINKILKKERDRL